MLVIDADAHLDGDWNVRALRRFDSRSDDVAKQTALIGQGRTTAAARDLGNRAAEIHVDVVCEVLVHDHFGRLVRVLRIDGVQLQ